MLTSHAPSVCAAFNLGDFISAQDAGGTRNHNAVFATSSGRWFVRQRFAGYSAPAQLRFDHAALAFLHGRGAAVLLPRQAQDGETWWAEGENVWEVFPFVDARTLRDGDRDDVTALGRALAQFHAAGKSFAPRYEKISPRGETAPPFLRQRLARIEKEAPQTKTLLAAYGTAVEEAARLLDDDAYNALPHTLAHGDVQPANLLLEGAAFRAFVDVDWCAWRARIYDLSFAILACCAWHESTFDGGDIWSLTQTPHFAEGMVEEFLSAYQESGEALSDAEKTALRQQIILTWCHIRLGGALKVEPARRLEFLERPPRPDAALWPGMIYNG